jgi:MoaA/NifB/PqqE/SkfB family radical SAM enzyme
MRWIDGLRLAPAVMAARITGITPFKVLLAVTDRCESRCGHCKAWQRTPGDELRPDEIARLLGQWPLLRWVDISGGEPTSRPDAPDVADAVALSARRLAFLHFATNGSNPAAALDFARRLVVAGGPPVVVTVSLDGDEEIHDRMRGVKGAFARAVETAAALARMDRVDVYAGTTVTPLNLPHLGRIRDALARALPNVVPDRWHVNLMNRSGHFFGNLDLPPMATGDVLEAVRIVEGLRPPSGDPFSWVEHLFLRNLRLHTLSGRAPVPCEALRASVFVGPGGDVFPCHIRGPSVGNVRDSGLRIDRVLAGPLARLERARIDCRGCDDCWTPCEAYPSMASHPFHAARAGLTVSRDSNRFRSR